MVFSKSILNLFLRVLYSRLVTFLIVLTIVFMLVNVVPGSPLNVLDVMVGSLPSKIRVILEEKFGLRENLAIKFIKYLHSVFTLRCCNFSMFCQIKKEKRALKPFRFYCIFHS